MSGIHLGIITEVNKLSRDIATGNVDVPEAKERLSK